MTQPLIAPDLLRRSNKILFIAHLALGDFTYLQNCFQAFSQAYSHLQIDLWVDEVRRTGDTSQWEHLKKYSLYDWVADCSFFHKIYRRTYSPGLYRESIHEARQEAYPIVVSLATLRPQRYAALARAIAGNGFVVGMKAKVGLFQLHHLLGYRKLDRVIPPYSVDRQNPQHISDVYADWFRQLCGIEIAPAARFPFVTIPERWRRDADDKLAAWGFGNRSGKLVFINPFAKSKKRCWPLERVAQLIAAMRQQDGFRDACFIVNAAPNELAGARAVFAAYALLRMELFCAEDNFFQLPAMLQKCDLIISVETAVMHLANAVHVPVIALMRQKNPEWVPIDRDNSTLIMTAQRREWVKAITVEQVMEGI
ncbi:MAG: glycosyltransferase family 9 protein [Glaciimonas sp.]|nr:glycosyltransferase family 9 protein [Glaciimonas sp.]